LIDNISQNFRENSPEIGLANRTAGTIGDNLAKLAPGLEKTAFANVALPAITGPVSVAMGTLNIQAGSDRYAQGEEGAGAAQMAQGVVQQVGGASAATSAAATLVAKTVPQAAGPASQVAGATGKFALRAAGPAVAGLEATKNAFEAVDAYQNGGDWLTPGYYAGAKGLSAGLMTNPGTAPFGGALLIGTSAGEYLNTLEPVQEAQQGIADWISDRLGFTDSLPPATPEEIEALKAQRRAQKP